ncbi:hypothetical protein [Sphingobacterium sp.]|uniref:hypothetical protein n=1 Tax=Sphingobacterium sp. TaxID=341027 RepID=UPI002FDAFFD9
MKSNIKLFMKSGIVLLFILISGNFLFAQKNDEIKKNSTISLTRHSEDIDFKPIDLKINGNYVVRLDNVNPAHHQLKVIAKSFEIQSALPEAFKNVLFLPSSLPPGYFINNFESTGKQNPNFESILLGKIKKLDSIKIIADELHKNTNSGPNSGSITKALVDVKNVYPTITPNDEFLNSVAMDINFINSTVNYLTAVLANSTDVDPQQAKLLAISQFCAAKLKEKNFLDYASYIMESKKLDPNVNYLVSKKFQTTKDLTEIRVILIDRYSKDTLYNENKTFYNKGGWGVSFSTGFFFNNNLNDKAYYLQKRADGNQGIIEEDKSPYDIAVGAMTHLYYKFSSTFRLGPGLGIAVSPFDGKTRYMLGATTLIGREKKIFGISAGIAWAKVKHFSGSISTDSNGAYLAPDATTVPTFDKIKNSFFIGLTYNVSSTRK